MGGWGESTVGHSSLRMRANIDFSLLLPQNAATMSTLPSKTTKTF